MSVTYHADGDSVVVETGEESGQSAALQPSSGEEPHPSTSQPVSESKEDSKTPSQPSPQAQTETSGACADPEGQPVAQADIAPNKDTDLVFKQYNSKASLVCGILQIIFGLVSLATGVVAVATGFNAIGMEIFAGVLIIVPGIFGVVSAKTRNRRHIIVCMVLSILSAILAFLLLLKYAMLAAVHPILFFGFIIGLFTVIIVALFQVMVCCYMYVMDVPMFSRTVCGCCAGGDADEKK